MHCSVTRLADAERLGEGAVDDQEPRPPALERRQPRPGSPSGMCRNPCQRMKCCTRSRILRAAPVCRGVRGARRAKIADDVGPSGGCAVRLIQGIRVENFRSIRNLELTSLEEYNPIVGLNSSGKSNLLRALNLFFRGVVDDEERALELSRDFSDYAPAGKKRIVRVGVQLGLSDSFKVRGQEEFHRVNGLTDSIAIQRSWSYDQATNGLIEDLEFGPDLYNLRDAEPSEVGPLLAHVRAVIYRYVPNHAKPSTLISQIVQPLRADLVSRLRGTREYRDNSLADVMEALERMGERMFDEVSWKVHRGVPNLEVVPSLPSDFADLAFDVAVSSVSDGTRGRDPELEGSGTQAFMLLHFLDLADRAARRSGFGWVQASVWAFEEPESFLHSGLRARSASDLAEYADDAKRQVFLTTHQDEYVRVGTTALFAELGRDGTSVSPMPTKDALTKSYRRSITTYRHPLLVRPDVPLILTEGKFDATYLRAAAKEAGLRPRWRLASPDDEVGVEVGGDSLKKYLNMNRAAIASRPDAAPILVLRDWETSDRDDYVRILKEHQYSTCIVFPEELANPELDRMFVGIERYLTTEHALSFFKRREIMKSLDEPPIYSVSRQTFMREKSRMEASVRSGHEVGEHMMNLVKWLDSCVVDLLETVPPAEFFH